MDTVENQYSRGVEKESKINKATDHNAGSTRSSGWKDGIYHIRIHHPEGELAQKVIIRH